MRTATPTLRRRRQKRSRVSPPSSPPSSSGASVGFVVIVALTTTMFLLILLLSASAPVVAAAAAAFFTPSSEPLMKPPPRTSSSSSSSSSRLQLPPVGFAALLRTSGTSRKTGRRRGRRKRRTQVSSSCSDEGRGGDAIGTSSSQSSSQSTETTSATTEATVDDLISSAWECLNRCSYAGDDDDSGSSSSATAAAAAADDDDRRRRRRCDDEEEEDVERAFGYLLQAYGLGGGGNSSLARAFEASFRAKIRLAERREREEEESRLYGDDGGDGGGGRNAAAASANADRMGLASLLSDQGRHEEAADELRIVVRGGRRRTTAGGGGGRVQKRQQTAATATATATMSRAMQDRAAAMLFRSLAAVCSWDNYRDDSDSLAASVRGCVGVDDDNSDAETTTTRGGGGAAVVVPALHPFEALKWPCISLQDATNVARMYARRAELSAAASAANSTTEPSLDRMITTRIKTADSRSVPPPVKRVSRRERHQRPRTDEGDDDDEKAIKLGYISPDFTGTHPLAFLMQDYFRFHDASKFDVHLYSLQGNDSVDGGGGRIPEVTKIRDAASPSRWTVFPPESSSHDIATKIAADELDMIIDLCGYTGVSTVAEVMSRRVAPVQISYMGFPGSTGAPYMDYMIVDDVVVPQSIPTIRNRYTENLILMPHSYFVNSHRHAVSANDEASASTFAERRGANRLPERGFVFCCHSRPDKIDPGTFRVWLRALKNVREHDEEEGNTAAVLWLLKSGGEMESNLREIAKVEFGLDDDCLVFADVAPRDEHLSRLALADVFLDTPAYNAHTVGCDALYAGVPMISLLRSHKSSSLLVEGSVSSDAQWAEVPTEKLASRVGASLLKAADLDEEMVVSDMTAYEDLMVRCATDSTWFSRITDRLVEGKRTCALFDTERWVRNLEVGLEEIASNRQRLGDSSNNTQKRNDFLCDIAIVDDAFRI